MRMARITEELRQRLRTRIDEDLPPIIKRSFAHHDKAREPFDSLFMAFEVCIHTSCNVYKASK